jgi:hypothetical protein
MDKDLWRMALAASWANERSKMRSTSQVLNEAANDHAYQLAVGDADEFMAAMDRENTAAHADIEDQAKEGDQG